MQKIGLFYATREGHTRKVVQHMADRLRRQGFDVEAWNVRNRAPVLHLHNYAGVILSASVHRDMHEAEMINFVKRHLNELLTVPSAFLSISLSQAGVQRAGTSPEEHARFQQDVDGLIERFSAETGWRPKYVKAVAGALLYTQYNPLIRFVMKRIAKASGGSTDTRRDHEYTDWTALDQFVESFVYSLPKSQEMPVGVYRR
jgi:menaquinone-dependent protoporphyrinogen oxidase